MGLFNKNADTEGKEEELNSGDNTAGKEKEPLSIKEMAERIATMAVEVSPFTFAVEDIFRLEGTEDKVVVGKVTGTVRIGDTVQVTNFGVESSHHTAFVTAIELGPERPAEEATDCTAALRIEEAKDLELRVGTVLHTKRMPLQDIYRRYYSALGDVFVAKRQMALAEAEIDRLSYAEITECWNLYAWYTQKVMKPSNDHEQELVKDRMNKAAAAVTKKIQQADEVYCVFSKHTGEPFMYSQTVKKDDGYMCSPAGIVLFPKQYEPVIRERMGEEAIEIKKIENGKDGQGIVNFLGKTFYMNGVDEVIPVMKNVSIANHMLVAPPDFSKTPKLNIPIMNPKLEKWLLLVGQLGQPQNEAQNLLFQVYFQLAAQEFRSAQFIVPMKGIRPEDMEQPDEQGRAMVKKNTSFSIATLKGKTDKMAVAMYTDWKRLRMRYGEEWNGMIVKMEDFIEKYDCAVNVTEYARAGSYITQEMFEHMP